MRREKVKFSRFGRPERRPSEFLIGSKGYNPTMQFPAGGLRQNVLGIADSRE
jgi:hypothetical protein